MINYNLNQEPITATVIALVITADAAAVCNHGIHVIAGWNLRVSRTERVLNPNHAFDNYFRTRVENITRCLSLSERAPER